MKYKVGDRVLVRKDLVRNHWYGRNRFVDSMEHLKGKVVTIVDYGCQYSIEQDCFDFGWTDEMFVGKIVGNRVVKND